MSLSVLAEMFLVILPYSHATPFIVSPESILDGGEYKDPCCGGKHYTDVPEDPTKTHQTTCPHQQEKQGTTDL